MSTDRANAGETVPQRNGGIRDRVLVLPSVICSHVVAERIADRVDGCVAAPHDHGCAQLGHDNERTRETLVALGAHPNVAGTVVVGLGCEHVQSDSVADDLEARGVDVRELSIQGVGGTEACVERGAELAASLRASTSVDASPSALSDLTIGIVSTDLAESTRAQSSPLVGQFTDRVVDAGGRVLVAGTERVAAHPTSARDRLADDDALTATFSDVLDANRRGPPRMPRLRAQADDHSFEAVTRAWGSTPIDEVLEYGERTRQEAGVSFVATASRFEEAATALLASGAHLVVHVTDDGIPTGHPIAPVVKVSASAETLAALGDDIDLDAREATVDDLETAVLDIVGGERSCTERHGVTSFAIGRVGPSM